MFALETLEGEWLTNRKGVVLSGLRKVVDQAMQANPEPWQLYYRNNETKKDFLRKYGFSDRIRYYWHIPRVSRALTILIKNLTKNPIPLALLSQYMPVQYQVVREGFLENNPIDLIHHKVMEITKFYSHACSFSER